MGHFRETVHDYPDLCVPLGFRELGNEVHGNGSPWSICRFQRLKEAKAFVSPRFVPLAFVAAVDVVPHRLFHVWLVPIPREDFQYLDVFLVSDNLRIVILFKNVESNISFIWNV